MKMVLNASQYFLDSHGVPRRGNRERFRNGFSALDAKNGEGYVGTSFC